MFNTDHQPQAKQTGLFIKLQDVVQFSVMN